MTPLGRIWAALTAAVLAADAGEDYEDPAPEYEPVDDLPPDRILEPTA